MDDGDVHLYSPVDSAVHEMLLSAFAIYARQSGVKVTILESGRRGLRSIASLSNSIIWVGATGLSNLVAIPSSRVRGNALVYYLHEPSTLRTKVQRRNGIVKSLAWHSVQMVDCNLVRKVVVSRPELQERAHDVYRVGRDRIGVAPLLMPPRIPVTAARGRVTYLGRVDDRRGFGDFLSAAPVLSSHGLLPTVLTGDVGQVTDSVIPSQVELIAEPDFGEDLKAQVLSETRVLWNPRQYPISQSGVTADALRYGCRILLTPNDPMYAQLSDAAIALDFEAERSRSFRGCAEPDDPGVQDRCAELFSALHGLDAFRGSYLPMIAELRGATGRAASMSG